MTESARVVEPRGYRRNEAATFQKTNERFGALSNMAPGFPLEVNGIPFGTSEALYQVFRFPHLPDVQRMVIAEKSPMTAKMKSKPYRPLSRADFEQIKVTLMRWCLKVKLLQNWNGFAAILEATSDKPIVEVSTKDSFWGAKPEAGDRLVGGNVMGRLLMELREQLRGTARESLKLPLQPPDIPALWILGRPLEAVHAERKTRPGALNVVALDLPTTAPMIRLKIEGGGVRRDFSTDLLSFAQLAASFAALVSLKSDVAEIEMILHSKPGRSQRLRLSLSEALCIKDLHGQVHNEEEESDRLPLFAHANRGEQ
jgi:ribA/ribD-fused uncharacterized protein